MFFNGRTAKKFYGIKDRKEPNVKSLSWNELRKLAKEKNIDGYTKMKREELERKVVDGS